MELTVPGSGDSVNEQIDGQQAEAAEIGEPLLDVKLQSIADRARILDETLATAEITAEKRDELRAEFRALMAEAGQVIADLRHKSTHDGLTGLYNREAFFDLVGKAITKPVEEESGERQVSAGALVFMDLNNFGDLNDRIGHEPANRVLQQFASISKHLRKTDMPARLGGDEFVLYLPGANPKLVGQIVARYISRKLTSEENRIIVTDEKEQEVHVPVTFAVGVTEIPDVAEIRTMSEEDRLNLVYRLITSAHVREKKAKEKTGHNSIAVCYPGEDGEDIVLSEDQLIGQE